MSNVPAKGYRTVAIETGIPWPTKEQVIRFRGRDLYLLPGSDKLSRMVRVETAPGFNQLDADKFIFEFLSGFAWAEQRRAVATFANWCTAPLNIGLGPQGISWDGTYGEIPDPIDPKAKLALALYREGLSLNLVPYQFLSFFKIINIIQNRGPDQIQWIKDNLQHLTNSDAIARIQTMQTAGTDIANYLYVSGRCAVSHAFDQNNVVNPDDPDDLIRLSADLPVIRELGRVAIERELGVKSIRVF